MDTRDVEMGRVAVEIATQGESSGVSSYQIRVDWKEFFHFIGIWLVTCLILFMALIIITLSKGGTNLIKDTIKTIDMLNMSFSLILSAMLEQLWSKEVVKNTFYKMMLGCEIAITVVGGMLYVAYSVVDSKNQLLASSFEINLGYTIISGVAVALGFLSRSLVKKN